MSAATIEASSNKKETAMQQTYTTIKRMILSNQLPIGTPIPQTGLMEQFGFSRTPLREALNKLTQEGLVHWEQNKRILIEPLLESDIDQLCAMRILLESFAVMLTIPTISDETLQEARRCLEDLQDVDEDSIDSPSGPHPRFHSCFTGAAGSWVLQYIERLNDQAARYRTEFRYIENRFDADAHQEILEAALRRDALQVSMLTANHYAKTTLKVISDRSPIYEPVATRQALRIVCRLD